MEPLTPRQQEILDFIEAAQRSGQGSPSFRDIADHFGFRSVNAVRDHVRALRRKGALARGTGRARSLEVQTALRDLKHAVADIPLFGSIPAGFADGNEPEADGCISVDVNTLNIRPTARTFALRVRGESMTGRYIADGDFVICEHGREPREGDIVAALIDNESTLKTYVKSRGKPYLKAENPDYPALIPAAELVIQGVVVGLVRNFSTS